MWKGCVRGETLPTLTLQPLNYFTLPPSPSLSTPSPPSSPSSFSDSIKAAGGSPISPGMEEGKEEEEGTEEDGDEEEEDGEEEGEGVTEVVPEPYFGSPNTSLNVHLGKEAIFDCIVHDSANQSVSFPVILIIFKLYRLY